MIDELFIKFYGFVILQLLHLGTETVVFLVVLNSTPKLFWEFSRLIDVVLEDSGNVEVMCKLVKLGFRKFTLVQLLLDNRLKSVKELLHGLLCLNWDETRQLLGEFRLLI